MEPLENGFFTLAEFFEARQFGLMRKVNTNTMAEVSWSSPKGKFGGFGKEISEELGRKPASTDLMERHPFDVEIMRLAPGTTPCPFHSHSMQWEFYHVIAGRGVVRDENGRTPIQPGDAFIFRPGESHQLFNDGTEDLIIYVVADNPMGESCHYPDSNKWLVRSPERRLIRSESVDYYDGEE
ncbi:MAG TPA: cupin domain-containing protein [Verrucomicrobiae bacterium]|nr:cupin domain-containing protein [Verrucomicrobiae bacterium]